MPLYEYECKKCHHRFERIVKFSDPPMKKCPDCGGQVEQMISAPTVQFKGSGWYVTDYAKKASATPSSNGDSATKGESTSKEGSAKQESASGEGGAKDSGAKESDSKKETKSKSQGSDKKKSASESKK
jgi:putative FmdB family regulatory protein